MLARIAKDPAFGLDENSLNEMIAGWSFTGSAEEQVDSFLKEVKEILNANKELLGLGVFVGV